MSPRSSKPKTSRKPKAKPVIKKAVTTTQTGGISARAKKIKVQGDLVAGNKIMTARRDIVINVASDQGTPRKSAKLLKKLWHTYCDALVQQHRYLNLQGIGADPNLRVELETIYVPLETYERRETESVPYPRGEQDYVTRPVFANEKTEDLSVMQMALEKDRLVIVGDPGSGKSTFLSHLVVRFAEAWDTGRISNLKKMLGWVHGFRLPIYVPLRPFSITLQDRSHDVSVEYPASLLFDYILRQLDNLKVPDLKIHIEQALENGQCLLLFDGLDEVPTDAQRKGVREAVENFVARYPNRVIVTCRTYAYHDASVLGGGFYKIDLRSFDIFQQEQFLYIWYQTLRDQLGSDSPDRRADDLMDKINASARLPELASNPLLLTVMAYVHYKQVGLPERRVQLYEQCVRVMLDNWETARRGQVGGGLSERLGLPLLRDETTKLSLICPLAWRMHIGGLSDLWRADIEPLVLPTFRNLVADDTQAREKYFAFLDFLVGRSGLLQEKDVGRYNFPHRTFQEYLTALWLISRGDWLQACFDHRTDTNWREVILLTVARLAVTQQGRAALDFICKLIEDATGEDRYRHLALAGECLRDMQKAVVFGLPGGAEIWDTVRYGLAELCDIKTITNMTMRERADAGRVLSWLGDPRPEVSCNVPYTIEIPAGDFIMGSETSEFEDERPQHTCYLPAYRIGKYLVTNAQYRRFVEDGGYTEKWRTCWTDAGWKWQRKNEVSEPEFWNDPKWNLDNHPVAGVSWYEAMAYCNWLKATTGQDFRLPTEAEWEKAARGTNAREWPWGNEFEQGEANTSESDIDQITAVGLFPLGHSSYDLQDCLGNVWEWTRSLWGKDVLTPEFKYPYDPADKKRENLKAPDDVLRVLRGGSWSHKALDTRCAFRSRITPDGRVGNLGFRCVLRFL